MHSSFPVPRSVDVFYVGAWIPVDAQGHRTPLHGNRNPIRFPFCRDSGSGLRIVWAQGVPENPTDLFILTIGGILTWMSTWICSVGDFLRILPWDSLPFSSTIWGIWLIFSPSVEQASPSFGRKWKLLRVFLEKEQNFHRIQPMYSYLFFFGGFRLIHLKQWPTWLHLWGQIFIQ